MDRLEYQPLAAVDVEEVRPEQHGFTLTGYGQDRAEYRLTLHFEMPLDPRTRAVLGELLSQAEVTVSRRAAPNREDVRVRERAHNR